MNRTYRIEITPDDNGTVLITVPAFPEVTTFADEDASWLNKAQHAISAIEEAVAARIAQAEDIPANDLGRDTVTLPALSGLKMDLYEALLASNLNRAQIARELGWHRTQVDRLFQLEHASRLDQLEAAAKVLGRRLDAGLVAA